MRKINWAIPIAVLAFGVLAIALTAPIMQVREVKIETYVPESMPLEIKVRRDESEPSVNKYLMRYTAHGGASKATWLVLFVPSDGKLTGGNWARVESLDTSDPASVAWSRQKDIRRLVIVVERLEYANGDAWVINTMSGQADPEALALLGSLAVPDARFVKKD
jgi:hypothetical protein